MAKNLFGYNVKPSDLPISLDGEEFVIRRLEGEISSKYNRLQEEAAAIEKNSALPRWLSVVDKILMLAGFILFFGALEGLISPDATPAQKEANGIWWFFGTGAACLLASLALGLFEWKRRKRVESSPALGEFKERERLLVGEASAALHIPADAAVADVFTFPYRKLFGKAVSALAGGYMCNEVRLFREGDTLCIADTASVVGIPMAKIEGVYRVMKSASFMGWNKQIPFNAEEMKRYKIKVNSYGAYFIKPYCALCIRGSEEFTLLFPAYEWETFAALLGSKARDMREVKKLS